MKQYICRQCRNSERRQLPCFLIVDGDDDYPIFCPYDGNKESTFKLVYPKKNDKKFLFNRMDNN